MCCCPPPLLCVGPCFHFSLALHRDILLCRVLRFVVTIDKLASVWKSWNTVDRDRKTEPFGFLEVSYLRDVWVVYALYHLEWWMDLVNNRLLYVNLKHLNESFISLLVWETLFCQDINRSKQTYQEAGYLFSLITRGTGRICGCWKTCFTTGFSFSLGQYMIPTSH